MGGRRPPLVRPLPQTPQMLADGLTEMAVPWVYGSLVEQMNTGGSLLRPAESEERRPLDMHLVVQTMSGDWLSVTFTDGDSAFHASRRDAEAWVRARADKFRDVYCAEPLHITDARPAFAEISRMSLAKSPDKEQ